MYRRISVLRINVLHPKVLPHMLAVGVICLRQQLNEDTLTVLF